MILCEYIYRSVQKGQEKEKKKRLGDIIDIEDNNKFKNT